MLFLDERDSNIGDNICKCLSVGSVPVILTSKEMERRVESLLPFSQVIDWGRAILKWRVYEDWKPGEDLYEVLYSFLGQFLILINTSLHNSPSGSE